MLKAPAAQPAETPSLQDLVMAQAAHIAELEQLNTHQSARIVTLQEQLNLALARRVAARSEKLSPDQIRLFDEAESEALAHGETPADVEDEDTDDDIDVPAHRRRRGKRKPLPETLPRVEIRHELPEDERCCARDGRPLNVLGEVVSEQLHIIPATIQVLRHVRVQYACDCGQCIKTASLPPQPIPGSNASPGLLAHITVSNYQDALPLHRQETILQRIGVDIPRSTLSQWMIKAGTLAQPLINLMRHQLLAYDVLQMDETTVQVLKEVGRRAQSQSYLWVQRGGPPEQPVILFDYDPSRGQAVPLRLLEGFRGYLQTDGYEGSNAVVASQELAHIGCWAHVRRKFHEAVQAQGKQSKKKEKGKAAGGKAQQGDADPEAVSGGTAGQGSITRRAAGEGGADTQSAACLAAQEPAWGATQNSDG